MIKIPIVPRVFQRLVDSIDNHRSLTGSTQASHIDDIKLVNLINTS
jgi:hypothetical protein